MRTIHAVEKVNYVLYFARCCMASKGARVGNLNLCKNFLKLDSIAFQNENYGVFMSKNYDISINQKIDDLNNVLSKMIT